MSERLAGEVCWGRRRWSLSLAQRTRSPVCCMEVRVCLQTARFVETPHTFHCPPPAELYFSLPPLSPPLGKSPEFVDCTCFFPTFEKHCDAVVLLQNSALVFIGCANWAAAPAPSPAAPSALLFAEARQARVFFFFFM